MKKPRVGFLSVWFERGQAYVTKAMREAIADSCETFVLARTGYAGDGAHLRTTGEWACQNLETYHDYLIPREVLVSWINENELDIVIFNEERQRELIGAAKSCQVATMEYVAWELFDISSLTTYCLHDRVICPTGACYDHLRALGLYNAVRIQWGVDLDTFCPSGQPREGKVRFFHPAGWMVHPRRGTEFVLEAFRGMRNRNLAELVIHSLVPLDTGEDTQIRIIQEALPSQSDVAALYRAADAAVLPSKWEGLGLAFPESLACGLPVITVDAPPMNEFVRDWYNGLCCRPARFTRYPGIYVNAAHVDVGDLSQKMDLLTDRRLLSRLRENAINDARKNYDWRRNGQCLVEVVDEVQSGRSRTTPQTSLVLELPRKCYSDCRVVDTDSTKSVRCAARIERATLHLVGARWSNYPWGMENELHSAFEDAGVEVVDTDYRRDFDRLHELLSQECHVFLAVKAAGIPPALVCQQKAPTLLWYPDDVLTVEHARQQIAFNAWAFDTVYSFDSHALDEYRRLGVRDVKFLPLAASRAVHRKLDVPKKYDVAFVGNVYPNRLRLFDRLRKRFDVFVTQAYMDDMVRIFNESKIVLNLGIGSTGIQQRVFEAMACGSFVLTNRIPDHECLFRDGFHLAYFDDDTIEDLIEHYLREEEERELIAERGRGEVLSHHTYHHRVATILHDVFPVGDFTLR